MWAKSTTFPADRRQGLARTCRRVRRPSLRHHSSCTSSCCCPAIAMQFNRKTATPDKHRQAARRKATSNGATATRQRLPTAHALPAVPAGSRGCAVVLSGLCSAIIADADASKRTHATRIVQRAGGPAGLPVPHSKAPHVAHSRLASSGEGAAWGCRASELISGC